MQRATDNMQRVTLSRQHATDNMQQTTCNVQHATDNMQRATDNVQHATDNRQRARVTAHCWVQLRLIVHQPLYVLPFLQPGRLARFRTDTGAPWGYGLASSQRSTGARRRRLIGLV
jgi:hypothetical protein